jgi:hypothetical protein
LLAYESGSVVPPGIGTPLDDPRVKGLITIYLETEFSITAQQLAEPGQLRLRHAVDDGAVIYLNGVELLRPNMPNGEINGTTPATVSVNNAEISDEIFLPKNQLVAGTNRLSVELHQRSATSNDILFGAELMIAKELAPGVPGTPYRENDDQWIELYNRSPNAVDLSGWRLAGGAQYEFPQGTNLAAGEFLVVAGDAVAMRQMYGKLTRIRVSRNQAPLALTRNGTSSYSECSAMVKCCWMTLA